MPPKPNEPYQPKGVVGFTKIAIKRYLFNLLDRTDKNWAKAVGPNDNRDMDGFYVSRAYYTKASNFTEKITKFRQRQVDLSNKAKGWKPIKTVIRTVKGIKNTVLPSKETKQMRLDYQNGIYDRDYRRAYPDYDFDDEDGDRIPDDKTNIFSLSIHDYGYRDSYRTTSYSDESRPLIRLPRLKLPSLSLPSVPKVALPSVPKVITSIPRRLGNITSSIGELLFERSEPTTTTTSATQPTTDAQSDMSYEALINSETAFLAPDRFYNKSEMPRRTMALAAKLPNHEPSSIVPKPNDYINVTVASDDPTPLNTPHNHYKIEKPQGNAVNNLLFSAADTVKGALGSAISVVSSFRSPTLSEMSAPLQHMPGLPTLPSMPAMPWDVYYRGAIPFFENAIKSAETIDKAKDNLVAQVMASDAADSLIHAKDFSHTPLPVTTILPPAPVKDSSKAEHKGLFTLPSLPQLPEPKVIAVKMVGGMFPLVSKLVEKVKDSLPMGPSSRGQAETVSKVDKNVAIEEANLSPYMILPEHNSYAKGSAEPGDGIGLGLGLDPGYVKAARLLSQEGEQELSPHEQALDAQYKDKAQADKDASSIAEQNKGKRRGIFGTIYAYTARPIIRAPIRLYSWTKGKLFPTKPTDSLSSMQTAPFDEERVGLQNELRQAVRDREVLPASVLDNAVLQEYDAAKHSKANLKELPLYSKSAMDKLTTVTSAMNDTGIITATSNLAVAAYEKVR